MVVFSMRTIDNLTNEELKNILQSSKSLKEVIRKIGYSPRSGENAYCKIIESLLQRGFTESEIPTKRNFTHRTTTHFVRVLLHHKLVLDEVIRY